MKSKYGAGGIKERRHSRAQKSETWVHVHCLGVLTEMQYTQMTQNPEEGIRQIGNASSFIIYA